MKHATYFFALLFFSYSSMSDELIIPNHFSAGTKAVASEVNENFSAVELAVDGNAADISQILDLVTALEARVNILEASNNELQADKIFMQNFIDNILPYMQGGLDAQGRTSIFFTGANVHVNNGLGNTSTINGLGNLIIGYDENFVSFGPEFCVGSNKDIALSADSNQVDCEANGGVWSTVNQKNGSHNLVVGIEHSYPQYGGLISGRNNVAAGIYSVVSGTSNVSSGAYSSISGGKFGIANGESSSISGGRNNIASGRGSSISGGSNGEAIGTNDWVAGTLFEDF
ncbi:MAG: hypothetical protein ACRBCS_04050 [Cellvibrionaceae bacterium]